MWSAPSRREEKRDILTKRAKRINPHKIPIDKKSFDRQEYIEQACESGLHHAWLLVLSSLVEQETMPILSIWNLWNDANSHSSALEQSGKWLDYGVEHAAAIMGFDTPSVTRPYSDEIRTLADKNAFVRRIEHNAVLSSLSLICLRFEATKRLEKEQLRQVFLNASITRAEIENGYKSYSGLIKLLGDHGIKLVYADSSSDSFTLRIDSNIKSDLLCK